MKKIISKLMGGVLLFSLSMSLTSCEDILGEWSRPTPNPVTPGGNVTPGGGSTINATAIDLNQTMKVIKLGGDALTITATATPTDATLTWESSDEAVATVTNGVVTPKSLGIATITAKSGDVKATCQVFVGNEVNLSSSAYEAKDYDILKGDMGANQLTIPAGKHVALDGLTINDNNIKCSGTATIYLTDGSTNTVTAPNFKAGIQIGGTGTLTINAETAGTGQLNATGGYDAAGIGTEYAWAADVVGGNITINGGVITAIGKGDFRGAAGIGTGGASTGYKNKCGAITINGGRVTATGGYGATNDIGGAGIGTGGAGAYSGSATNECGAITINGGWVNATGAKRAAGIGTGTSYANTISDIAKNTCGAITIKANVTRVTATKGDDSPNIIGYGYNSGGTQTCGTITFGTAAVFNGSAWSPATMVNGTYGGLELSTSGNTWILKPSN